MESWEKLTNPKILRENLISFSVYISSYEICREFIVSKPRDLFTDDWGIDGETLSEEYHDDVMSHKRSPLQASLLWFKERFAIDDEDIKKFDQARMHRNEIAHEMPKYISQPGFEVDSKIYSSLLEVTHKIGVHWVLNHELPIDPEHTLDEANKDEIQVGTIVMLNTMRQIAFGQEPEEGYLYNEIKRKLDTNS